MFNNGNKISVDFNIFFLVTLKIYSIFLMKLQVGIDDPAKEFIFARLI